MSERPSQVNDPARAREILQPLQGAPLLRCSAAPLVQLAGATSGATASGDIAAQSSARENVNEMRTSNSSTVNLEVYIRLQCFSFVF